MHFSPAELEQNRAYSAAAYWAERREDERPAEKAPWWAHGGPLAWAGTYELAAGNLQRGWGF